MKKDVVVKPVKRLSMKNAMSRRLIILSGDGNQGKSTLTALLKPVMVIGETKKGKKFLPSPAKLTTKTKSSSKLKKKKTA